MFALTLEGKPDELDAASYRFWSAGCLGLEDQGNRLVAYFPRRVDGLSGEWRLVAGEDWSTSWRKGLAAVKVGALEVWPSWLQGAPPGAIILDPGMAFGTGHHATTCLALQAMQGWVLKGRSFLDVGSGSGILALAACRLGATRVLGLDTDPVAVEVARENAAANGLRAKFSVQELNGSATLPRSYAVVANLYLDAILEGAAALAAAVGSRGRLAVTGLLSSQAASAAIALVDAGLALNDRVDRDGWTLLEFVKPAESPRSSKLR